MYGNEDYLLDRGLRELKDQVVSAFEEINYVFFEGKNISEPQFENACETLAFGSEKKLIVLKDYLGLKSKQKKDGKKEVELEKDSPSDYDLLDIKDLSDDVCVLFIVYGDIDRRKKIYKDINKLGSVFAFKKINKKDLKRWIERFFTNEGKEIGNREIEYLIQSIGYLDPNSAMNLYHVQNEMEKILSYAEEEKNINMNHIKALVTEPLENNVFKLIDACMDGEIPKALNIYSDLLMEGKSSYSIIGLIAWGIKNIIKIKELSEEGFDIKTAAKKLRMNEFVAIKNSSYCQRIDFETLNKALEKCIKYEAEMKMGKIAETLAIEMLLITLF